MRGGELDGPSLPSGVVHIVLRLLRALLLRRRSPRRRPLSHFENLQKQTREEIERDASDEGDTQTDESSHAPNGDRAHLCLVHHRTMVAQHLLLSRIHERFRHAGGASAKEAGWIGGVG